MALGSEFRNDNEFQSLIHQGKIASPFVFSTERKTRIPKFQSLIHQGKIASPSWTSINPILNPMRKFQSLIHQGKIASPFVFSTERKTRIPKFQSLIHQGKIASEYQSDRANDPQ